MSDQFQVTAECAHVTTSYDGIRTQVLMYKGAFLPAGVDREQLKFLIDGGLVSKVGSVPLAPNASVVQDPARGADSVTVDELRGEPAEAPAGSGSDVSGRVADAVRAESGVDKAAESPRDASDAGEAEARRAEARAKLAEIGGTPDGRSSDTVMVEFLVGKGYDRGEVEKADRAELKALVAAAK